MWKIHQLFIADGSRYSEWLTTAIMMIEDAVVDGKVGNTKVSSCSAGIMEEHRGSSQQISIRCCLDTIVISDTIAIATMTIVTEREVRVAVAQMW